MYDPTILKSLREEGLLLSMDESDNEKALCICPWCRSPKLWIDLTSKIFHCPACDKQGTDLGPVEDKLKELADERR